MSYRERHPKEPQPIQTPASRFSLFGACVMLIAVPLSHFAKEHGWIVDTTALEAVLGLIGFGCVIGAWIAYRSIQKQVARDMQEVEDAGRVQR